MVTMKTSLPQRFTQKHRPAPGSDMLPLIVGVLEEDKGTAPAADPDTAPEVLSPNPPTSEGKAAAEATRAEVEDAEEVPADNAEEPKKEAAK